MSEPLDDAGLGRIGMQNNQLVCKGHLTEDWCACRERLVVHSQDNPMIHAEARYQVPILPSVGLFAEVVIGDPIATGAALMWMEFTPDIGRMKKIPLGFWNPGEGMNSIRGVILDYVKSQLSPSETFSKGRIVTKCPSGGSVHDMRASRIMKEKSTENVNWKFKCLWDMVFEGACTVCIEVSSGASEDNFGITSSSIGITGPRSWGP